VGTVEGAGVVTGTGVGAGVPSGEVGTPEGARVAKEVGEVLGENMRMVEGARVGKPLPARSLGESDAMTVGGLVGLPVKGAEGNADGTTVDTALGGKTVGAVGIWETLGISVGATSGISVGDKLDFLGVTVGAKLDEKVGDDEDVVNPVGSSLGKPPGFDDGDLLRVGEAVGLADGAGDGDAYDILVWVSMKAFQNWTSSKSRSVPKALSRPLVLRIFSSFSMPPFNALP
jgi:hypothetical protein